MLVAEVKRNAGWYVEIAYETSTLSVRGFVPKSALSEPQRGGYGMGYGRLRRPLEEPTEQLTFATGACLYAEPWGEVVGVLRLPFRRASTSNQASEQCGARSEANDPRTLESVA